MALATTHEGLRAPEGGLSFVEKAEKPSRATQKPSETPLRSVAKAVSWRVGGTLFTAIVAWVITREVSAAATIGAADMVFKIGAYYVHERVWDRISFGRGTPPDYQI